MRLLIDQKSLNIVNSIIEKDEVNIALISDQSGAQGTDLIDRAFPDKMRRMLGTRHGGSNRDGETRMGSIEYFEHTADVGIRATAETLEELFQTAAEALFGFIVVNRDEVRCSESETVELDAESTADLLVAWLNELIFRCETQHKLYSRFEIRLSDNGRRLQATIAGEPIDRDRHILDHEVKAVTHHGLVLHRLNTAWVAEFILDI